MIMIMIMIMLILMFMLVLMHCPPARYPIFAPLGTTLESKNKHILFEESSTK